MSFATVVRQRAVTGAAASVLLVGALASGNAHALSKDEASACTVILCLAATVSVPSACIGPLKSYFLKKPWKRASFLRLCPKVTGGTVDDLVKKHKGPDDAVPGITPPGTPPGTPVVKPPVIGDGGAIGGPGVLK